MQIFFQGFDDSTYTLDVEHDEDIAALKRKIQQKCGLHPVDQRLMWEATELEVGRTLSDYSIGRENTIHLVRIPYNGPPSVECMLRLGLISTVPSTKITGLSDTPLARFIELRYDDVPPSQIRSHSISVAATTPFLLHFEVHRLAENSAPEYYASRWVTTGVVEMFESDRRLLRRKVRGPNVGFSRASALMEVSSSITFKGRILDECGIECYASFPGKYPDGWRGVTREKHRSSVGCVFLPSAEEGLGQHAMDPANPGKCFCPTIYGARDFRQFGYLIRLEADATASTRARKEAQAAATGAFLWNESCCSESEALAEAERRWEQAGRVASWGCEWFARWTRNIERAVEKQQRLVVFFFEGEVGNGKVLWERLADPDVDPWDDVGLGGSQKCEVAYLDKMVKERGPAYAYEERDVAEFIEAFGEEAPPASHTVSIMPKTGRWTPGATYHVQLITGSGVLCGAQWTLTIAQ